MKTFGKNSISSFLYWLFILCFIGVIILFVRQVAVYYAHANESLIENNNDLFILQMSSLTILPKIISFYLLIVIFKSFRSDTIFTKKTLLHLKIFAIFSLCMPVVYAFLNYFSLHTELMHTINIMFPNLLLGVFAIFIAAILKKGIYLREENDLTI